MFKYGTPDFITYSWEFALFFFFFFFFFFLEWIEAILSGI